MKPGNDKNVERHERSALVDGPSAHPGFPRYAFLQEVLVANCGLFADCQYRVFRTANTTFHISQ